VLCTRVCTMRACMLRGAQRVFPTPVPQGGTKWQAAVRVGGAASRFGLQTVMSRQRGSVLARCIRL